MFWMSLAFGGTEMIAMSDGTELATDVWVPAGDGPFPTILRRTPYGRAIDSGTVAQLNLLGYAVVTQDVRGRGRSEGSFLPFFNDAKDGTDTLAWIVAQPWSNGKVGGWGASAEAVVQLMAAGEGPEGLSCMHLGVPSPDVRASVWRGGAWRTDLGTNWLEDLGAADVADAMKEMEVDGTIWDSSRLSDDEYAKIDVPSVTFTGYMDIFESEVIPGYGKLRTLTDPAVRDQQYLVLGPWTHGGAYSTTQGEVRFPDDSQYTTYIAELVGFFNWCLKDGAAPAYAPVRYYVATFADSGATATGEWRDADSWPPDSTPESLYLGDGLSGTPSDGETPIPVDPADPVPSVGGGNLSTAAGIYDQSDVDAREDVAVFATAPATEPVEIVGQASARIWASSATTDADVIVRVEIVAADGAAWLVADGIRRGRFVGGEDAIVPLEPGVPVEFDVDLGPMGWTLAPGQSLRIAVSGTLSPRYEPNPSTAVALADDPVPVPTTLTIVHDADHPSTITLPIVSGTLGGVVIGEGDDTDTVDCCKQDGGIEGGCGCQTGAGGGAWIALVAIALGRRRDRRVDA